MNVKTLLVILFLTVGSGVYALQHNLFGSHNELIETVRKIKVWKTTGIIVKGSRLNRQSLEIKVLSEKDANAVGVSDDVILNFDSGAIFTKDMDAGELVTPELLLKPSDPGYVAVNLEKGFVPYTLTLSSSNFLGTVFGVGERVDVSLISSREQNLSTEGDVSNIRFIEISPLLADIKLLKVIKPDDEKEEQTVKLVLALKNEALAKLLIAQRIGELEVHKSSGSKTLSDKLRANSSDVLSHVPQTLFIREYRGDK